MNWTLFPASGYTKSVATLWWAMFGVGALVWIAVVVSVAIAAPARRGFTRAVSR